MQSEHLKTSLAALLLLTAMLASSWSGFDLWLTNQFYSAEAGGFVYRDQFLLAEVLHDWLKKSVVLVWLLMAGRALQLSLTEKHQTAHQHRFFDRGWLIWIVAASALCALAVSILKNQSAHSCPWYLTEYGGTGGYFELWAAALPGPGRCFPSGHASVGWMWLACLIAPIELLRRKWREHQAAMRVLTTAALTLGLVSSAVQVLRGAHFASHVLATALVCTVVCLLLSLLWPRLMSRFSRGQH